MGKGHGTLFKKILAAILAACIVAVIVAVCIVYIPRQMDHNGGMDKLPGLKIKVNNTKAFEAGGASHNPTSNVGVGPGQDQYTYYTGPAEKFPKKEAWVSFDDMWDKQLVKIKTSCSDHQWGENNSYGSRCPAHRSSTEKRGSDDETEHLRNAIQSVAKDSLVENRLILAIIMQESKGCIRVHSSNNGVQNPGVMQSHNGHAYDPARSKETIRLMIQDGTQGTADGPGLAQLLDQYGNAYAAARGYNSGAIAESGNLNDAISATPCYVTDVANRLTGWVEAQQKCDDAAGGSEGNGEGG